MIEGEAVRSFTLMFLQLWGLCTGQEENYVEYLTLPPGAKGQPRLRHALRRQPAG